MEIKSTLFDLTMTLTFKKITIEINSNQKLPLPINLSSAQLLKF